MIDSMFIEISAVIVTAGLLSLVFHLLKQPLIIAYILTGLLVGPSLLNLTQSPDVFTALSEIGVAFLLFLVGLGLNWRSIKDVGLAASLAGFGQVFFTTGIGFFIGKALGFDNTAAIFLATAFAFSSTIIIVKLLSDKQDLDRFYGRISVGVLIIQDLIAMVILLIVGAMRNGGGSLSEILAISSLKAAVVMAGLFILSKYVLPHLFKFAARSQELLFLTALAWCFALASALYLIGFGIEVGALLAGIAIAGSEYHREIESKIRLLRDFFLVIFFIVLGTHLTFVDFGAVILPTIVFSLFILIGNPFIVIFLMRLFGFHPRTGFMVGTTMAQISEFSFILLSVAIAVGFLDTSILTLATMVGLCTIAASTYLINYNEQIYRFLEPLFKPLEQTKDQSKGTIKITTPEVLIFGYEHIAETILPTVKSLDRTYTVVDFDPARIEKLRNKRIPVLYGDAGNEDFLDSIKAYKAELIISTIPDMAVNEDIAHYVKQHKGRTTLVFTAKSPHDAVKLYEVGANFVILPSVLGGELFAQILKKKQTNKVRWNSIARKQKKAIGV